MCLKLYLKYLSILNMVIINKLDAAKIQLSY